MKSTLEASFQWLKSALKSRGVGPSLEVFSPWRGGSAASPLQARETYEWLEERRMVPSTFLQVDDRALVLFTLLIALDLWP